jgi:hypothetical protein
MSMSQKDAVFSAVTSVLGNTPDSKVELSKEQRAQVNMIVFEGFRSLTIGLDKTFDDAELKSYVSGLTSNWLRKDTRLNGGGKYEAKNPGSRQGSSDPQLKAMRALITTVATDEQRAEIQGYIDARVSELSAAKQVKVVDFSALPADLAAKFGK